MPRAEAPLIDKRTYSDLVAQVEDLIHEHTGKPAPPKEDAGWALVRIFGRMAELVVNRLNRLPDRNLLAFLDLIGTRLNPPQPARVPLTFLLAAGSPVDAWVPAGTQAVAAASDGEAEPPVFATERGLVVTRSQLVAVFTREPGRDLWADHTAVATGRTSGTFRPFQGDRKIAHRLYVDHPLLGLPEAETAVLRISLAAAVPGGLSRVTWSFWNGTEWKLCEPTTRSEGNPPGTVWTVKIENLRGLAPGQAGGHDGHWLCGTLEPYGGDWPQPVIDSLSVRVTIHRTKILPDRGFAHQTPLDLSRDFLPFGEKPKAGDVFYLASEEAFSKPDTRVDLLVERSATSKASDDLRLAWEFWDGALRMWQPVCDLVDNTDRLTRSGKVSFTIPGSRATEVHGEVRHWIRVWIAAGNYGVEAHYEPVEGGATYKLNLATFQPPALRSILVGYSFDSGDQAPRCVLTENDFRVADVTGLAAGSGTFSPFVPSADLQPSLYLGFERPGDPIGFANRTTALFFQVSEALFDPAVAPKAVTEEAAVAWDFWNGKGWDPLGTADETRGLTRHGLLTFIGPPDFEESTDFGRKAFWLRGRWARGEYAVEPQLVRVLTNTMWAANAETIREEILGSSRGEPGQVFHTRRTPVLDGPVLEVVEPEVPSGADLALLEEEEGDDAVAVIRDATGQLAEVRVRWHEVPDFHGSGLRSRHFVLDPLSGEVRFGDGRRGLVPPPGRNNVRMALYRAGGGLAGNRPPGSITRLKGTVPYVAGVVQPLPAEGGAAAESLEAVRARGPKALRHRHRAVAAADFEDLAFQASSQVARARALPPRDGSEAGQVSLIIVPASGSAKPVPGLELLARVRAYLEARLSPVVDFRVTGPDWLQMDIKAEIVPQELDASVDVQNGVIDRLRAFLHPLSGGPDGEGWELGRRPHRSDLYALIEETPGVDHVLSLQVTETPKEGGARPGRFHVFSGTHKIDARGDVDDVATHPGSRA